MRIVEFKNGVQTILLKDYKTFPRLSKEKTCVSRVILNLKNLLVNRGITNTDRMIMKKI
jgi:hypothetical protein